MAKATLSNQIINIFHGIRALPDADAKAMRKQLFSTLKAKFGIPEDHALKVELDDTASADYAVLLRKKGNAPYELHLDGKWVDWAGRPVPTPAALPTAAPTLTDAVTSTVYPTNVPGQAPRRFFRIDIDGVYGVINSVDYANGVDVLENVVTDKQVDYKDGKGLRRTIILADNTMYAEFTADEL